MSKSRVAERSAAYALKAAVKPVFETSFDLLATAPQGVVKLRELILSLAVRGKLLPQNSADEPVRALLDRTRSEVGRFVVKEKSKRGKPLLAVIDDERPFEVPCTWQWLRIADLCSLVTDGEHLTPQRVDDWNAIPLVTAKNVRNGYMDYAVTDFVSEEVAAKCWTRCKPECMDILMVSVGATLGRLAILREAFDMVLVRSVTVLRPIRAFISSDYLALHLRSPGSQAQIWRSVKQSAQPCLYLAKTSELTIALPPIAEQARIVARVEELMQLCDALEAHGRLQDEQHARLVATLFDALAASTSAEGLAENWQRIATYFDLLLDRPEAVDALEQTLLQLAVRGLLVPQDPADEPANQLLARIQKSRVHKRKFATCSDEAIGHVEWQLPNSWCWASIDQMSADDERAITDGPFGANLKTEHYIARPGYRVIRLQNIGHNEFRDEHRAYIEEDRFDDLVKHQIRAGELAVAGLIDTSIRCCVVPDHVGPAIVKADCYRFAVHPLISNTYIAHYLNSTTAQEFASVHHHGLTLKRIGLGNFRTIPVPLPPLAEQHRIVTRVEQLRCLCADLRERLQQARATQSRLADALVSAAARSPTC